VGAAVVPRALGAAVVTRTRAPRRYGVGGRSCRRDDESLFGQLHWHVCRNDIMGALAAQRCRALHIGYSVAEPYT
jgi:hypothetical protein